MKIIFANPDLSLEHFAMTEKRACDVTLLFTAVRGKAQRRIAARVCLDVPNDRDALPTVPTVGDVVRMVIRRQHPVLQYVAELNGVIVEHYHERYSFSQSMSCISYGN